MENKSFPSEWVFHKLEDCMENIIDYRGKTPKKSISGIPLVTAKIVKKGRILWDKNPEFIQESDFDSWMTRGIPKPGDVVMTMEAPLGEVAQLDERKVALAQRIITLSGKIQILDNNYLRYLLQTRYFQHQIRSRSSGTTVLGIKQSELRKINIPIPLLDEQKAIAEVLSSLDDKIDLLHRQNKTLEAMAETLFRQWFIEEASEDWEEKYLADVVDIAIGRTPPRKEFHWFSKDSKDVKWVSIKDLGNSGTFVLETSEYLTNAAIEKFNIPIIPKNTVLLSFKMTIGRVAITTEDMLSNEAIAHFVFNDKTPFIKEYLYFFLKLFKYQNLGSTSSIVTSINSKMIKELPIKIPNQELMLDFENSVKNIFAKIRNNQLQIDTLENLRDTLLPKLMSGKVRVRV